MHTNSSRVISCNAEQQQAALDKPIDLFKAIFENDDDSAEEESDTEQQDIPANSQTPAMPPPLPRDHSLARLPAAPNHLQGAVSQLPLQLPSLQQDREQQQQQLSSVQPDSSLQQQQQLPSVQPQGPSAHQSGAVQTNIGIQRLDNLSSQRSSKKKRKHKEDDKEKSRSKKHKKDKQHKHSGTVHCFKGQT